jgi:hypothetical protein
MTDSNLELWNKIKDFEIDDPSSSFTFSDRLARENSWTTEYTVRSILEYKKFIFLLCISKESLTPSDQVDQVWHLHLLYTRSYWIDFCKNTLHKEIHHGPTKGAEEAELFENLYNNTFKLYKKTFLTNPPTDIWLDAKTRFGETYFTRVNRHRNWVLPKIKF